MKRLLTCFAVVLVGLSLGVRAQRQPMPSAKVPPNTVLQVLEQGFMMHDRVLRPAKVIVSKPAE